MFVVDKFKNIPDTNVVYTLVSKFILTIFIVEVRKSFDPV